MSSVHRPRPEPQIRARLTEAAAIIAGLLVGDPTPADARQAAREWLLRSEVDCPCGQGRNSLHAVLDCGGSSANDNAGRARRDA